MESIWKLIDRLPPPDEDARRAAKQQWDSLAKPLGSLGLLEELVCKIAALRGSAEICLADRRLLVFCADHGVVRQGVTQCGSAVTAQVAKALAEGRSSVSPMARLADCRVIPVDVGMCDFPGWPGVLDCRVKNGTDDLSLGPAMTRAECLAAIEAGASLARAQCEDGADILLLGEMGIGNTTAASALAAVLTGRDADELVGRGAGLSDAGLRRKREIVRRAVKQNRAAPGDIVGLLQKLGGLELAAMCGAFLGAAVCRVPAVIDGFLSAVSALCALRLCPAAEKALLLSHRSAEPAGDLIVKELGLAPPIDAGLRLGEGSGAVALLPLLDMALAVYRSGQSFARLGVEPYRPLNGEKSC